MQFSYAFDIWANGLFIIRMHRQMRLDELCFLHSFKYGIKYSHFAK